MHNLTDGQYFFFGICAIILLFTAVYFVIDWWMHPSDLEHSDK